MLGPHPSIGLTRRTPSPGPLAVFSFSDQTTRNPASKKDGCLFGYKKMKGGICKAPITGINHIDGDYLRQYSIRDWEDEKTKTNCSYIDDVIKNFRPAQFKKWAELMASRECPGVPHDGLVPGIPKGSASISQQAPPAEPNHETPSPKMRGRWCHAAWRLQ